MEGLAFGLLGIIFVLMSISVVLMMIFGELKRIADTATREER